MFVLILLIKYFSASTENFNPVSCNFFLIIFIIEELIIFLFKILTSDFVGCTLISRLLESIFKYKRTTGNLLPANKPE